MPDDGEHIWIDDAAREYRRSRAWLDEQVRHGKLTLVKFPGDRRSYLKRAELDALLHTPREQRKDGSGGSGGASEAG